MTRDKPIPIRAPGQVLVPAATIGGLSLILAGGLELLGVLDRLNAGIARLVAADGAANFPKQVPAWCLWLAAGLCACGLASAILGTSGHGRRAILWITAVVLVAAWAPVLSLAAHAPDIAAPCIATLWAGICAVVYAANHRMACDEPTGSKPSEPTTPADDPR